MIRRTPTAIVPLSLLVVLLVAACGATPTATPAMPTATPTGSISTPVSGPTAGGGVTTSAPSSGEPIATAPADVTTAPGATGPVSPTPVPSIGAEACTGSAENRDFFAAAAETMTWVVYCAVLPEGWYVDTGSYRLADGGRLDVTYRGPGGSRVELRQGAFCTADASACAPSDRDVGPAAFGDRTGTLVMLGPSAADGFAVYVDPGAAPSWSITGVGIERDAFVSIAAALHRVTP